MDLFHIQDVQGTWVLGPKQSFLWLFFVEVILKPILYLLGQPSFYSIK